MIYLQFYTHEPRLYLYSLLERQRTVYTRCIAIPVTIKKGLDLKIRHVRLRETKRRRKRKLTVAYKKKEIVERKEMIWIVYGGLCQKNWQRGKTMASIHRQKAEIKDNNRVKFVQPYDFACERKLAGYGSGDERAPLSLCLGH